MRVQSPYFAFHRDKHLLLQFIIQETLLLIPKLKALEETISDKKNPQSAEIITFLRPLLGGIDDHLPPFTLPHTDGHLAKLKGYTSLLLQDIAIKVQVYSLMDQLTNDAWIFCVKSYDCLQADPKRIFRPLWKMIYTCKLFLKTLPVGIKAFLQDENVLFFIVRHQKELDAAYGPEFTEKLISSSFSNGLPSAKLLLLKRYQERGFHHLLPVIEELFATL